MIHNVLLAFSVLCSDPMSSSCVCFRTFQRKLLKRKALIWDSIDTVLTLEHEKLKRLEAIFPISNIFVLIMCACCNRHTFCVLA